MAKPELLRGIVIDFVVQESQRAQKRLDWADVSKRYTLKAKKETEGIKEKNEPDAPVMKYQDYITGLNGFSDREIASACKGVVYFSVLNGRLIEYSPPAVSKGCLTLRCMAF